MPHAVTGNYSCSASNSDITGPMSSYVNITFVGKLDASSEIIQFFF